MREEVGMAILYIAERLSYRVAFLLKSNRHLLAFADYLRAKKERITRRRGFQDEGTSGQTSRRRAKRKARSTS